MNIAEEMELECGAENLARDLEKIFKRFRVNVSIDYLDCKGKILIFKVKLKGGTREAHIRARMRDVQQRLKLPHFELLMVDFKFFLIVSEQKIEYVHLPRVLNNRHFKECCKNMCLPYVVGYNVFGILEIVDLAQFPHLLLAGSSNSGKSVGLQNLIAGIIFMRSPQQVNFILIDVGAVDLAFFNGIPHLSYPVVDDRQTAFRVLGSLMAEMERRIKLKASDSIQFEQIPRLILVIDEFPALVSNAEDKQAVKMAINAISGLLQRGRHAKIHVVLAAQNPTMQNMKVDLGNITARIAFRCAKKNFSETIIGESGAENLTGQGDMCFKSPQQDKIQRMQGMFISEEELKIMLFEIKDRSTNYEDKFEITINEADLQYAGLSVLQGSSVSPQERKADNNVQMFIHVLLWTLGQRTISCNLLMSKFSIGWKRAQKLMDRLNSLGIVEDLDSKLSRRVLVSFPDDLPEELMDFLSNHGVSFDELINAFGLDD